MRRLAAFAAFLVFAVALILVREARAEWLPFTDAKSGLDPELVGLRVENAHLRRRNHRLLGLLARRERMLQRAHRQLRSRFHPSVMHAIQLASTIWHVPQSEMVTVGSCESHLYPFAANGRYRGVFQEGPMFERGPFGRAGFSVWDPYANVFTAALTVSRQGWRQWQCRP